MTHPGARQGHLSRPLLLGALLLAAAIAPMGAAAAEASDSERTPSSPDLANLSLEQLMDVEVTSVSKRPQRLGDAAAAIFVITQDDIRRSGMTSIPELLRMVPGLDVAQADSRHWAVASRGFNGIYSPKLLVLVDGRAVYSPAFSGVLWDLQDMPLEDIERIEVIRGPGGTLWGANAVNGVINIITKSAADTQGLLASVGGGTEASGIGMVRYGGKLADGAYLRVYAKGFERNSFDTVAGASARDSWRQGRVGFRFDWTPSSNDTVMAQGEYYREKTNGDFLLPSLTLPPGTVTPVIEHDSGGHALISWRHRYSDTSDLSLQAYYDRVDTGEFTFNTALSTYDVELRHRFRLGDRHDVVWGAGYRHIDYVAATDNPLLSFVPPRSNTQIANVFAQDEITLTDPLHLIVGTKIEHNSYTGFEFEPNARLSWRVSEGRTLWAAVSRAVRTPSAAEDGVRFNILSIPGTPPVQAVIFGNTDQKSEQVLSWEAGYRAALTPTVSLDAAVFYSTYRDLVSVAPGAPYFAPAPPPPHIIVPLNYGNALRGETYGVEISANWRVTNRWRLSASYSYLHAATRSDLSGLNVAYQINAADSSPSHQVQLHSHLDLPWRLELDTALYYASSYTIMDRIPAHTRVDARLGWRPFDQLEISLVGQNLFDPGHEEAGPPLYRAPTVIPRSIFIKATVGL